VESAPHGPWTEPGSLLAGVDGLSLEARIDALCKHMAGVGHDLMQPLQIVAHALNRLDGLDLAERDRLWLRSALSQTERIAGGLRSLLHSPLCAPGATARVDLAALLGEAERDWSGAAALAGVGLRLRSRPVAIRSDPHRLRSILDNLIGNAIKYSPTGRILVGCRMHRGEVVLDVLDNGCGIALADQERVFAAFCQLDCATEGLGLGLSLVRDHCAALEHRIELASIPGRGSRFRVRLGRPLPDRA
jgi:signal transduction histidine kinase